MVQALVAGHDRDQHLREVALDLHGQPVIRVDAVGDVPVRRGEEAHGLHRRERLLVRVARSEVEEAVQAEQHLEHLVGGAAVRGGDALAQKAERGALPESALAAGARGAAGRRNNARAELFAEHVRDEVEVLCAGKELDGVGARPRLKRLLAGGARDALNLGVREVGVEEAGGAAVVPLAHDAQQVVVALAVAAHEPHELREPRIRLAHPQHVGERRGRVRHDHALRVELHQRRERHERRQLRLAAGAGGPRGVKHHAVALGGRRGRVVVRLRLQHVVVVERQGEVRRLGGLPTRGEVVHGLLERLNLQQHERVGKRITPLGVEVRFAVAHDGPLERSKRVVVGAAAALCPGFRRRGRSCEPKARPDVVLDGARDATTPPCVGAAEQIQYRKAVRAAAFLAARLGELVAPPQLRGRRAPPACRVSSACRLRRNSCFQAVKHGAVGVGVGLLRSSTRHGDGLFQRATA
mmetsp:Transcript_8341/g.23925  ORF Transcript_8341/g.23925 Transcript_8341/m.23925 type:complete len:467 (-) Transcript_8341:753-2153(-)